MPDAYTYIPKPTGTPYTNVNPQGREQYDQANIEYDDPGIFYDGIDPNAWTDVSKPPESFGPEILVNGNFTGSATGWNLGTGWAYNSNNVIHTPGNILEIDQTDVVLEIGKAYEVQVTIGGTAGTLRLEISGVEVTYPAGVGQVTFNFVGSETDSSINFEPSSDFDGTLDGVSTKEVTNEWTYINKPTI